VNRNSYITIKVNISKKQFRQLVEYSAYSDCDAYEPKYWKKAGISLGQLVDSLYENPVFMNKFEAALALQIKQNMTNMLSEASYRLSSFPTLVQTREALEQAYDELNQPEDYEEEPDLIDDAEVQSAVAKLVNAGYMVLGPKSKIKG
jgi:hypothetical protein